MIETTVPLSGRASHATHPVVPPSRVWGYVLLGVALVLALVNVVVGARAGLVLSGAGLAAVVAGTLGALLVEVPPAGQRTRGTAGEREVLS